MNIGDRVETSCDRLEILQTLKPFKGVITAISKDRDDLVKVKKECGCSTWIDTAWLRKIDCSCQCHCHCSCHCCCSH